MKTHRQISALIDDVRKMVDEAYPAIVSLDGMDGVGKSHLARELSEKLCLPYVEVDKFLDKNCNSYKTYVNHLHLEDLLKTVNRELDLHGRVLLDGVCMLQVMRVVCIQPSITIYMKLMNGVHANPPIEWWVHKNKCDNPLPPDDFLQQEYAGEEYPLMNCLTKDLYVYHYEFRPHEQADLLFERFMGNA